VMRAMETSLDGNRETVLRVESHPRGLSLQARDGSAFKRK
jgi:hypothetical protein